MAREKIPVRRLVLQPYTAIHPEGVILVCAQEGNPASANPMTISWGTFGIMWEKPVVMVMVRPNRHSHHLISQGRDFTLNWMPTAFRKAVNLCGQASGRDTNKWSAAGITAEPALSGLAAPVIKEAVLSLECRILYREDLDPKKFLQPKIKDLYSANDYHSLYFGEVVEATGFPEFRGP
jgi:flavin reductase (DIM6/NTAB) family NADH-FMN oxidoreductase RutF